MRARRHILTAAAVVSSTIAAPLAAAPIERHAVLPEAVQVIDIRSEDACIEATLPDARCLPTDWLFAAEGGPIGFGELRWLLGTLGLSGAETVAIFPADAVNAQAAAALIYLAGQSGVVVYVGEAPLDGSGETRSFSREAVFTAPMRLDALRVVQTAPTAPLTTRLDAFARGLDETVAFGPAD